MVVKNRTRRKCLNCEAWFKPKKFKNYCCGLCRREHLIILSTPLPKYKRECAFCGKSYLGDVNHYRFCSEKCKKNYSQHTLKLKNINPVKQKTLTSPSKAGYNLEISIKAYMEARGYYVMRSNRSHGLFDLISIKENEVMCILCRRRLKIHDNEIILLRRFMLNNSKIRCSFAYLNKSKITIKKISKKSIGVCP